MAFLASHTTLAFDLAAILALVALVAAVVHLVVNKRNFSKAEELLEDALANVQDEAKEIAG